MSHPHDSVFGDQLFLGSELASELYVDEVLDGAGRIQYLDSVRSMSGLPGPLIHWPADSVIEEQHRRFHSGS